jgi:O-antigen/teichoic acid export membrane protein
VSSITPSAKARTPLPEGTIPVGISLLIAGLATYAFFKVGTVAVGGIDEFAPIAAMWFAVFALAPGFFLPLEQELGRALSHRRAVGDGGQPVVRRVVGLGGYLVLAVTLGIMAMSPLIATSYFDGNWFMVIALILAFAAYAPAHMARGVCSGSGRFREYAIVLGSDGIVRILLCVLLALVGVTAVGAYGLVIAISPLFAVAYVYKRGALRTDPGPPAELSEVTPNLGWLLIGSVCAATLLNAGPITASLLAPSEADGLVTAFSYGVLLSRIPLFLFQAVQAALLPRLSQQAARGEFAEFRSGLLRLTFIVIGVGILGTFGAYILGPWALQTMYASDLTGRTLAMLALSAAIYMLALATAQAVIALQGHALVALGWALGVIAFVLGTWLSSDNVFKRIEIGLVVSSTVALVAFALSLRHRLRVGAVPDQASMMEAITDMPFEI